MNEKQSYTEYNVIVPTQDFIITFEDYNSNNRDAIDVTVDGVPATTAGFTVLRISDTVIQLTPAVESGSVVRLQRETDIDNTFYQFTAGAIFTAGNVDKNFQQVLHSQQEVRDSFEKLSGDVYPLVNGLEQALQTASNAAEAAGAASDAAQFAAATAEAAAAQSKYMLNYYDPAYVLGGASYPINSRLTLANGDVVISTIPNNINNPDVDMTGWELALPHVDTEGTYTKVTTDEYGRVVSGENPDTLAGMGITDAYTKTEVDNAISTIAKGLTGFSNLKISSLGINNYQSVITASKAVLSTSLGATITISSVNVSPQINASGVNGLDAGSVVANTWYYLYLISDGTLVRGLFSLSATNPTLPSGYTYFARVGAVRTGASGHLLQTLQYGNKVQYVTLAGSNVASLPVLASGAFGSSSITSPTYVAISTSNVVPPTAPKITVVLSNSSTGTTSSVGLAPNSNYSGVGTSNPPFIHAVSGNASSRVFTFVLETSNIYAYSSTSAGLIQCLGWEDNL